MSGTWIMCEATADWDAPLWTNKQHLMAGLGAAGHNVLYLDSLGLRRPSAAGSDLRRIVHRVREWRPTSRLVAPGVWRDAPLVVPLHSNSAVRELNRSLIRWRIGRNRRVRKMRAAVLWSFSPMGHRLFDSSWQTALIYHCVDNIPDDPNMERDFLLEEERTTIARARVCIASSRPLQRRLEQLGAVQPLYWPNPAETERFAQAQRVPHEGRPIVGFVGAIQDTKIDVELLLATAALLPEYDFHLAGPVDDANGGALERRLKAQANVRLLGVVNRGQLPNVIGSFDVAIIPYRISSYTEFIYPMKVFEYLATGAPVVATPLPSLVGEVDHVVYAPSPAEFAGAIAAAIPGAYDASAVNDRRVYASSHSWTSRVREAEALLAALSSRTNA